MKNRLTYIYELYRSSQSIREAMKLQIITRKMHKDSPKLSRTEKNMMLQNITGRPAYSLINRRFMFAGLVCAVLLFAAGLFSWSAQPDDGVFYHIRRGVENIRGVVQPGFEPQQTLPVDDHKNDSELNSTDDNSGRGNSSDQNDDRSSDNNESENSFNDDNKSEEHESEHSNSGSSSGSSNESSESKSDDSTQVEGATIDHNAARDACRASLDARKKAGEEVDSSDYKKCDE